MTLLKRLITSVVLFPFLFVVIYIGICMAGGAVSGAIAGAKNPQMSYEAGREAGANFVRYNIQRILLGSIGGSAALSVVLSFSGVFPWCRKAVQPPPLY